MMSIMLPLVFDWAEGISLFSIVVNVVLVVWIVDSINKKDLRKTRDRNFILSELKLFREDLKKLFQNLYNSNMKAKELNSWLKLLNIKLNEIAKLSSEKLDQDMDGLKGVVIYLRAELTELEEYEKAYQSNKEIPSTLKVKSILLKTQSIYYPKLIEAVSRINRS